MIALFRPKIFKLVQIAALVSISLSLSACKSKDTNNDTNSKSDNSLPFVQYASWGPVELAQGNLEDLYIENGIGIGFVSHGIGSSSEGTDVYALNTSDGEKLGDTQIPGRCYRADISGNCAYVWVDGGINVYDLSKDFTLMKSIKYRSGEFTSNFGDYFYVEERAADDYVIDKINLEKVDLRTSFPNYRDDSIYGLLYPNCLIGSPDVFQASGGKLSVVYSLKDKKILGYGIGDNKYRILAWDPSNDLIFYYRDDQIVTYNFKKEKILETMKLTKEIVYSIVADFNSKNGSHQDSGDRLGVVADISRDSNGCYYFNAEGKSYIVDSAGKLKNVLRDSYLTGGAQGRVFLRKDDALGLLKNDLSPQWLSRKPTEPSPVSGPYFTKSSVVWLCETYQGDGLYQWSYETGSYSNYTEFSGYDVEILSADPTILALRSKDSGNSSKWKLVCCDPGKLPFSYTPDIELEYSPKGVYSNFTQVTVQCLTEDLPEAFLSQGSSYEWSFGDGEKDSGQSAVHVYKKPGSYTLSVSMKIGQSQTVPSKSVQIEVLASPEQAITAIPQKYTAEGLEYLLKFNSNNLVDIQSIEWDYGDGKKGSGGVVAYHVYRTGEYTAKIKVTSRKTGEITYSEIQIVSRFPELKAVASVQEGVSALPVDFVCEMKSTNSTDNGLKYQWMLGSEILGDGKSCSYVFAEPKSYTVSLEVRDPSSALVTKQNLSINVRPPTITVSGGGRVLSCSSPIFMEAAYDKDKDGINQTFEDLAMEKVNPYLELDEEEDMLSNWDKAANFVMISPYTSAGNKKYVIFTYGITFSRDYGRFHEILLGHNGDIEKVVMAWEVLDEKTLKLRWVYTSAHSNTIPDHSGVWCSEGKTLNLGKGAMKPYYDEMIEKLEFKGDVLKFYVSEDKHAIYPSEACGNNAVLVYLPPVSPVLDEYIPLIKEDVGSGGEYVYRFACYNIGEQAVHLIDDIGFIFQNERVWSGNIADSGVFAGGLDVEDGIGTIGGNLSGDPPKKLKDVLDGMVVPKTYQ